MMMRSLLALAAASCALALPMPQPTAAPATGMVAFAGVNIPGFDFSCQTDGTCTVDGIFDVVDNGNALQQMNHFVANGLNAFRLPVGWQFLVNYNLGGPLDPTNFPKYDKLVQGCISSGAKMCIVDIHNYARWDGGIIGQGGPSNAQYTNLLTQLATKYAGNPQVAFDIMNEPHDLDITTWAGTAQAAVTAIRNAGAKSQIILIPGMDYASAGAFPTNSGPALLGISNPDGSKTGLIFNVHQYLDADHSGTQSTCVYNNINEAFAPLATWLRANGRMAMITETGGGPTDPTCFTNFCAQNSFINQNSDVYLGLTSWGAGGFATSYVLSNTPFVNGNSLTDQELVNSCLTGKFKGVSGVW